MSGYGQYCPLAKGAEVFAEKWTPLILRELLRGAGSFNDVHRGVPRMSRSLLSARLRKLESCGVLERQHGGRGLEYRLTEAGLALGAVVSGLGEWGQRWYRTTFGSDELDVGVLMWDMRCTVEPKYFPQGRTIVQFRFADAPRGARDWWLVNENCEVDFCPTDPGTDVDLLVLTSVQAMTRIWMGDQPLETALRGGGIELRGPPGLKNRFGRWLRRSPYADIDQPASAYSTQLRPLPFAE
jgi:DNA-binding HxlR family transcriptional regulator